MYGSAVCITFGISSMLYSIRLILLLHPVWSILVILHQPSIHNWSCYFCSQTTPTPTQMPRYIHSTTLKLEGSGCGFLKPHIHGNAVTVRARTWIISTSAIQNKLDCVHWQTEINPSQMFIWSWSCLSFILIMISLAGVRNVPFSLSQWSQ